MPSDATSCASVPPINGPAASPLLNVSSAGRVQLAKRLRLVNARRNVSRSYASMPPPEPPVEHRPMERNDPAARREIGQHRREIAVADERFRRRSEILLLEVWKQVHAAVTAAHGDERAHRWIAPRIEKRLCPHARRRRIDSPLLARTRSLRTPARIPDAEAPPLPCRTLRD